MQAIYASRMATPARPLALYLSYRADEHGISWCRRELTLLECDMCDRTYRQGRDMLVNAGVLRVVQDRRKGEVFILDLAAIKVANFANLVGKNCQLKRQNLPKKLAKVANSICIEEALEGAEKEHKAGLSRFPEFIGLWPLVLHRFSCGGDEAAFAKWVEHKYDSEADLILLHVKSVIIGSNEAEENNGQFLMAPATYLQTRAWRQPFQIKVDGRPACPVCGARGTNSFAGEVWFCSEHGEEERVRRMMRSEG